MTGAGVLSILVALVFPMDRYEGFLFLIGAMFVPLFGVVLTDYFFLRHRALDLEEIYRRSGSFWYSRGFHGAALVAWASGFAVYELIELARYPIGASMPSMGVAGALYLLLARRRL